MQHRACHLHVIYAISTAVDLVVGVHPAMDHKQESTRVDITSGSMGLNRHIDDVQQEIETALQDKRGHALATARRCKPQPATKRPVTKRPVTKRLLGAIAIGRPKRRNAPVGCAQCKHPACTSRRGPL